MTSSPHCTLQLCQLLREMDKELLTYDCCLLHAETKKNRRLQVLAVLHRWESLEETLCYMSRRLLKTHFAQTFVQVNNDDQRASVRTTHSSEEACHHIRLSLHDYPARMNARQSNIIGLNIEVWKKENITWWDDDELNRSLISKTVKKCRFWFHWRDWNISVGLFYSKSVNWKPN